ncbi:unnamed protein product [Gongylonema pulchrum]|uniref:Tetratricopeptide repeat protein 38 n=1 Tax=Gongylonema pulchrum TaxID=637853 RepID=A0A183E676_9BILA|nr:unnamed protein product [Gongylonema pulchrum]
MAEWCAENLRDCQVSSSKKNNFAIFIIFLNQPAWRAEGIQISTSSNEAARLYDGLLRQYVSWSDCEKLGGMDKTHNKMIEAEPDAIMSRVISLGLEAMGTGRSLRLDEEYRNELQQLLKDALKRGTEHEKKHAKAVHIKMVAACEQWEEILRETPNDMLAVKFAHDAYFYLGDKESIRDSIARVFPKWNTSAPCYSYLHGMHAFGLEECGQYEEAEKQARKF